jgi:hypothetical protein
MGIPIYQSTSRPIIDVPAALHRSPPFYLVEPLVDYWVNKICEIDDMSPKWHIHLFKVMQYLEILPSEWKDSIDAKLGDDWDDSKTFDFNMAVDANLQGELEVDHNEIINEVYWNYIEPVFGRFGIAAENAHVDRWVETMQEDIEHDELCYSGTR